MRYRVFGRSGLRVSELCLGTMTFGDSWGFGADEQQSRAIFTAYREAGGNFLDTANNYNAGQSEEIVGALVGEDRDRFVLSTKYSLCTDLDDLNAGGNHRKNMRLALDRSLRRLGTDHVDIYWVHVWDAVTPVEEVMRGLEDLVRSGRVLHVGISDTPAWVVSRANMLAELRGWAPFVGLQTEYSLIERTPERDLLPMARALGLAVMAWAPLGAGILSGKYQPDGDGVAVKDSLRADHNEAKLDQRALGIATALAGLAQRLDRPPAQLALAWIRQRPGGIIPIVGARTVAQLRQNLGCLDVQLQPADVALLDEATQVDLGFPHAFLDTDLLQRATFGDSRHLLDRKAP
jgi:aryl-alcohol dehydrogenase-like predicted oxidoreductase